MFDVGDLPVLTFGNWVLKAEWLNCLWNYMYVFYVFFQNPKIHDFLRFLSCCTRFPEQCPIPHQRYSIMTFYLFGDVRRHRLMANFFPTIERLYRVGPNHVYTAGASSVIFTGHDKMRSGTDLRGGARHWSVLITWLIRILSPSPAVCIQQSATLTRTEA